VTVIATGGLPSTLAAKGATATIPVVFQFAGDPVEIGVVASLNRPGGNLTGITSLNVEIAPKQIEMIHDVVPATTDIALLVNLGQSTPSPADNGGYATRGPEAWGASSRSPC
jgi:ABC-type uncharacterized transport system substrate-binding protein